MQILVVLLGIGLFVLGLAAKKGFFPDEKEEVLTAKEQITNLVEKQKELDYKKVEGAESIPDGELELVATVERKPEFVWYNVSGNHIYINDEKTHKLLRECSTWIYLGEL